MAAHLCRVALALVIVVLGAVPARAGAPLCGSPEGIPDDGYDGTLEEAACCEIFVGGEAEPLQDVDATITVFHGRVGDLTIKLRSPEGTVATLMSRPGLVEGADDGSGTGGFESDWDEAPVTFDDDAGASAESLGQAGSDVCSGDGVCLYASAPDSASGDGLGDFVGEDPNGAWLCCVADGAPGESGDLMDCSLAFGSGGTTTTSTSPPGSTTTTTLPGETLLAGKKLLLKDKSGKPEKRALALSVKDPAMGAGAENGGAGDPVLHGGFLKVASAAGDGFNSTYDLPAERWRYKGKEGKNKGYKLRGAGPIRSLLVKLGKGLKVVAKGADLGHSLGADPNPVHVTLGLGARRYCFTFGGETKFTPGKAYLAKNAAAPGACQALVPACGDRLSEPGEQCPTLEGGPDDLAVDATVNVDADPGVPQEEVAEDAGARIARTRVDVEFAPDATVGQVNALLAELDGEILTMLADVPLLAVRIPDPGSLAALDALLAAANGDPAVRVARAYFDDADVLPGNFIPPQGSDLTKIDNHLAVRAPAAWNARATIDSTPLFVIGDAFGNGVPILDYSVVPLDPTDFGSFISNEHGYHVLGIAAATFGGAAPCAAPGPLSGTAERGCATGMLPSTIGIRAVDSNAFTTLAFRMLIVQRALVFGNVVVNTSRNECASGMCNSPAIAATRARQWISMVRATGYEDRVLHVTSAGNISSPAVTDATLNSSFSAATLLPSIPDFFGTGTIPNLTNTLVVENVVNGPAPGFAPLCLDSSSKRGGQISGIGNTVWSLTDATSTAGDLTGTSMATPQVAGLAAYLWAIDPSMTVAQLRSVLGLTSTGVAVGSTSGECDTAGTIPAPIIDAYDAVLALDEATLPTPATAPVRHALLDADDDGTFDEDDLDDLVDELIDRTTDLLFEPADRTWDRADLNGDGFVGGAGRRAPFDLDRVGSAQYGGSQLGTVTQILDGESLSFDETAVNDLDVLCYYAYSDLYDGNEDERQEDLDLGRCMGIVMTVDFPSVISEGTPEQLLVTIGRQNGSGSTPLEGIHVELTPSGGTANPTSGTTSAAGEFLAEAALDPGSTAIEIVVRAFTEPGGALLAEKTVSAGGPCIDSAVAVDLDFGNGEDDPTVAGPVLQSGTEYRITVSGTYTVNSTQQWANGVCRGTAAAGVGGPTGIDAEFFFAVPVGSRLCDPEEFECCPNHTDKFAISLDGGGSFAHVEPVVPDLSPDHTYEYRVLGQGAPVHFGLAEDSNRGDDYGVLHINIECASGSSTTTTITVTTTSSVSTSVTTLPTSTSTTLGSTTSSSTATTLTTVTTFTTVTASSTVTTTSAPSTSTLPSTTATSTSTTTTLFGLPVVPYTRYAATGPDGPVVTLENAFVTETVNLGSVALELPPVAIDGLQPFDPFTHQTCHAHPGGTLDDCVDIQDRFGFAPLRVGNPVAVCAFERSPSIVTDAFTCYQARGSAPGVSVELDDEFQSQTITVGAPELVCAPTAIDDGVIGFGVRYLVCYATAPQGAAGAPVEVDNVLHQDPITVDVGVATGLCVPAVRQGFGSCQLCGNGVVDLGEDCDDGGHVDGDLCSAVCRFERDCTCDGNTLPPPQEARCATIDDCGGFCGACELGGGECGCQ